MPAASEIDDDRLVRLFVAGDPSAMESLYSKYRAQVYSWLVHTVGPEDAGDVHQEAWLRVVRSASSYRGGNFRAWLWRIVRNLAIDRSRLARPQVSLDEPLGGEEDGQTALDMLESEAAGALERMEAAERAAILRDAIDALPPLQKEVVLFRVDAEMTFAEIAALTGTPLNTVLGRMRHAVKKLKGAFERGING